MRKLFFLLLLAIPVLLTSCGDDEDGIASGGLKVTYKVISSPADKTYVLASYNDNQGNFIVDEVESGWSLDVELPKGKKAFINGAVMVKSNFTGEVDHASTSVKVQILKDGKVIKEAEGLSAVVEVNP